MTITATETCVLLLVEDNPGDADLVREMLSDPAHAGFNILHVSRLADAIDKLRASDVDVIVLDLRLPDCDGVASVKAVRQIAEEVPIIVLTGSDDEVLAHACIEAGAHDYLAKEETRARNLKRAIGYAIARMREAQIRTLKQMLERYRALSTATQSTTVTAALAGSGAIKLRSLDMFEAIVTDYYKLLDPYLSCPASQLDGYRAAMLSVATRLGDASGGPRDLLDAHIAALERAIARKEDASSRSLVFEARLLALEMMGLLVDYYRVGQRWNLEAVQA